MIPNRARSWQFFYTSTAEEYDRGENVFYFNELSDCLFLYYKFYTTKLTMVFVYLHPIHTGTMTISPTRWCMNVGRYCWTIHYLLTFKLKPQRTPQFNISVLGALGVLPIQIFSVKGSEQRYHCVENFKWIFMGIDAMWGQWGIVA